MATDPSDLQAPEPERAPEVWRRQGGADQSWVERLRRAEQRRPLAPGADGDGRGLRDPLTGRVSPWAAIRAYPLLFALPLLAFVLPAAVLGLTRTPVYTAESRVLVGLGDRESAEVFRSQSLAATYARLVTTPAIAQPAADELGAPLEVVRGSVDASPIPESSIIRVEATADSTEAAIARADAAARSLVRYASSGGRADAEELLAELRDASLELDAQVAARDAADLELRQALERGDPPEQIAAARQRLAEAEAGVDVAQIRLDTLRDLYARQRENETLRTEAEALGPAVDAGSDRMEVFQLAVAAAVLGGALVGLALVTVLANRQAPPVPERRPGT